MMEALEQIQKWVDGVSEHDYERNTCCPDYSCCIGKEHMVDKEKREHFIKAYTESNWLTLAEMSSLFYLNAIRNGLLYPTLKNTGAK